MPLFFVNPNDPTGGTPARPRRARHARRVSAKQRANRLRFGRLSRAGKLRKGVRLSSAQNPTRAAGARAGETTRPRRTEEARPMAHRARNRKGQFTRRHGRRRGKARHRRNPSGFTRRSKRRFHHKRGRFSYNARRRGGRRRSRRFRHNPVAIRGIVGQLTEAGKRALIIVLAQAVTGKVSGMIPIGGASLPATIGKQAGVGLLLAALARKALPRFANDVLVGALLTPVTTIVRQVPVVGTGLAGAPPGLGLWDGRVTRTPLRGAPPGLGRWTEGAARAGGGGLPESSYYN